MMPVAHAIGMNIIGARLCVRPNLVCAFFIEAHTQVHPYRKPKINGFDFFISSINRTFAGNQIKTICQ
jgi:hypothetical protein